MNNDVMVTVICLCYNHEKYIRKALDSVVSQKTNFKFDVLVHDDASTDSSADIIREYAEKYPDIIKPVIQTENQLSKGLGITKNIMVPIATGKYICFCECDDFWCDENKLQKQYDIMENNPNLSICVHRVTCVNEDGEINGNYLPSDSYGLNATKMLTQDEYAELLFEKGGYPFHTSSFFMPLKMLKSDFYKNFDIKINGDQLFSFTALIHGDLYYLEDAMSCRRTMVPGSYNDRLRTKSREELFAIQKKYIEAIMRADELSDGRFHNKIAECVYKRIINSFFKYDFKFINEYFKDVNKRYPFKFGLNLKLSVLYIMVKYLPGVMKIYSGKKQIKE